MAKQALLLIEKEDGWELLDTRRQATIWQAANLDELLDSWHSLSDVGVVAASSLVIFARSERFLFSRFPRSELAGSSQASTWRYRFEADLPINAEEILVDFQLPVERKLDANITGVASYHSLWSEFAKRLASTGLAFSALCPQSLVLIQALLRDMRIPTDCILLLEFQGRFEIVALRAGQVVEWRVPGSLDGALSDLRVMQAGDDAPASGGLIHLIADEKAAQLGGWQATSLKVDAMGNLVRAAEQIAARSFEPWFNLRHDSNFRSDANYPAPRGLEHWLWLLAASLLIVAGAFAWRAVSLQRAVASIHREQSELYRAAFPGERVPSALMARLRSEYSKLLGSRQLKSSLDIPEHALPILQDVLEHLPSQRNISLVELSVNDAELTMDVEVEAYQLAGEIVKQLEQSGLEVDPPSISSARDERVRAVIRARRIQEPQR